MNLDVYKIDGSKADEQITLDESIFGIEPNDHVIYLTVKAHLANKRQGTSKAKERNEVRGGGRKPWKQKGTGRARAGSTRSTIWVGGGVAFGNVGDRNWNRKINKKMAKKATCVMLSENLRNKTLEFIKLSSSDVKKFRDEMKKNPSMSALVITDNVELGRKIKNIEKLDVVSSGKLNAKNIAKRKHIYVDNEVVEMLEKRLTNEK